MSEQNHAARKKNTIQTTEVDDSDAQKERIIAAAYSIGTKQGLAAISARGVARNANVSVGYLYKLFPSKSDIMVAAAERYFDTLSSRIYVISTWKNHTSSIARDFGIAPL